MPEFGFPPQAASARINSVVGDLRKRSETAQVETVTGRHEDPAAALDGQVGELFLIQKALSDNGDYRRAIGLAEGRTTTMQTALEGIQIQIDLLLRDVTNALEFGNASVRETVGAEARTALGAITSALNMRFGDRGLFSGDAGDNAAIAQPDTILAGSLVALNGAPDATTAYGDLSSEFTFPGGLFETQIYLGGSGSAPAAQTAAGERIDYGQRADDPALRNVIRDIAILSLALDPASGLDDAMRGGLAEQALGGLRNSVPDVVALRSKLGVAEARIADARARNLAAEAALTISYNDLAGSDQFEAAEELKALEVQLQTAYATTARLSNLNLASYLG